MPTIKRGPAGTALALLALLAAIFTLHSALPADAAARNHRPVARPDAHTLQEDTLFSASKADGVLRNDSDRNGDRLVARLTRATDHGTINLSKNGSFMYDPADDYWGPDSFAYKACEAERPRICSPTAVVTLNVRAVNDAPAAQDDFYVARQDRVKTVSAPGVLANNADVDEDRLHVAGYTKPRHGRITVGAGGSLRFVPDEGFSGKTYFGYWAADEDGLKDEATVHIRVLKRR
jgi:hypothetical protein